jgi:WD40 repeat protein
MNLLDNRLVEYYRLPFPCTQIKFSNGGHLFAIANGFSVLVYKFYTMEHPPSFTFNKHEAAIVHIQWLEDDSGFLTCGSDKRMYFWNLYNK